MALYDVSTNEKKAAPSLVAGGTLYADSPIGTILPYGGASAPSGWFLCDGTAVSRTTYSELFAVIGTAFGSGDGSTTFNLPDMRGKTAMGVETDHDLGASEDGALPNITGAFDIRSSWGTSVSDHSTVRTASGCITSALTNPSEGSYNVGSDQHPGNLVTLDASLSSSIYKDGQAKVDPANVRVNYIIKAKMVAVPADFLAKVDKAVEEKMSTLITKGVGTINTSASDKILEGRARYTKIDNVITVTGYIRLSADVSSFSGELVSGLPSTYSADIVPVFIENSTNDAVITDYSRFEAGKLYVSNLRSGFNRFSFSYLN